MLKEIDWKFIDSSVKRRKFNNFTVEFWSRFNFWIHTKKKVSILNFFSAINFFHLCFHGPLTRNWKAFTLSLKLEVYWIKALRMPELFLLSPPRTSSCLSLYTKLLFFWRASSFKAHYVCGNLLIFGSREDQTRTDRFFLSFFFTAFMWSFHFRHFRSTLLCKLRLPLSICILKSVEESDLQF